MKKKSVISVIFIVGVLGTNNYFLNEVSKKEKLLVKKEKELEAIAKIHEEKSFNYENSIDLEKIKEEFEQKGMKSTRQMEYFKAQTPIASN